MRKALLEDVDELAALERELFPDNCFNERTLNNELKLSKCWVEERDGKLIGYVLVRIEDDMADILRLGVLPGYHKQGVATRLLTRALQETPGVMLTVRKENDPALSLYFSFGFQIIGETEGSWVMLKRGDCRTSSRS